jgi:hypothetical protein
MGVGSPNHVLIDVMTHNLPEYMPKLNFEDKAFNTFYEQQRVKKYYEKDIKSLDNIFPLSRVEWKPFTTHAHINPDDIVKLFGKLDNDIVKFLKQRNKDIFSQKYKKNKSSYKWLNSYKIIKILYNSIPKDNTENLATNVKKQF